MGRAGGKRAKSNKKSISVNYKREKAGLDGKNWTKGSSPGTFA